MNRLQAEHNAAAPTAYPEVHYLTAPLRAHGRGVGNPDLINPWAGQAHELGREIPAGAVVAHLMNEANEALEAARVRLAATRRRPS